MKRLVGILAAAALVPAVARAAGLGVPDLGAVALGQGAANVAAPDEPTALYYNPAALASQAGLQALVDLRGVHHGLSFQRTDAAGRTSSADEGWSFAPVSSGGPVKLAPMFAVSYRRETSWFPIAVAVGGHPATGYSGYAFPDPVELRKDPVTGEERKGGTIDAEVEHKAPQRYMLISNDSVSYTFDVAVAAQLTDRVAAGLTLQSSYVNLRSSQSLYANVNAPGQEISGWDAVLHLDATDAFTPAAALGFSAQPVDGLFVGASVQLPANVHATGTLKVDRGPVLTAAKAQVRGDEVALDVKLPWIGRLGVRLVRPAFEAELAFTYDGWSRYDEVVVTPRDVSFVIGDDVKPISPLHLKKGLVDAQSLRLGGVLKPGAWVDSLSWLTLRGGVLGETSAVPVERTALDQAHWERLGVTAGVGVVLGSYRLSVSAAHFLQPDRQVRTSAVKQPSVAPDEATIVGNGDYRSQLDLFAVSVAGRWGR